jgi:hypothetical protein
MRGKTLRHRGGHALTRAHFVGTAASCPRAPMFARKVPPRCSVGPGLVQPAGFAVMFKPSKVLRAIWQAAP